MVNAGIFLYFQPSPTDHTTVHRWLGCLGTLFTPGLTEIERKLKYFTSPTDIEISSLNHNSTGVSFGVSLLSKFLLDNR